MYQNQLAKKTTNLQIVASFIETIKGLDPKLTTFAKARCLHWLNVILQEKKSERNWSKKVKALRVFCYLSAFIQKCLARHFVSAAIVSVSCIAKQSLSFQGPLRIT